MVPRQIGPPGPSTAAVIGPPPATHGPPPDTLHALVFPKGYGLRAVHQCVFYDKP